MSRPALPPLQPAATGPDRPRFYRRRAHVVSRLYAPEAAAAAFRLQALVADLVDAGWAVDVTTTVPAPGHLDFAATDLEANPLLRVRRFQARRDASGYVRGYLPYMSFDLPLLWRLGQAGAIFGGRARPEVFVVEPPPTTGAFMRLLAGAARRPYVYYAADVWSDAARSTGAPKLVVKILTRLEAFALRGAQAVIAVSPGVAERVKQLGARRVEVVENGIDTQAFDLTGPLPQPVRGFDFQPRPAISAAAGQAAPLFLYAGTASEWQGAEIFIAAFGCLLEQYPQARLLFLGQGSSWPTLRQAAAELPAGTVGFAKVSPEQAAAWQRQASANLVSIKPGLGYDFAYPTKIFAGLACGTPVLYAGPGPARADIAAHELGAQVDYDLDQVLGALRDFAARDLDMPQRQKLRDWTVANRSMAATGAAAAALVRAVGEAGLGLD